MRSASAGSIAGRRAGASDENDRARPRRVERRRPGVDATSGRFSCEKKPTKIAIGMPAGRPSSPRNASRSPGAGGRKRSGSTPFGNRHQPIRRQPRFHVQVTKARADADEAVRAPEAPPCRAAVSAHRHCIVVTDRRQLDHHRAAERARDGDDDARLGRETVEVDKVGAADRAQRRREPLRRGQGATRAARRVDAHGGGRARRRFSSCSRSAGSTTVVRIEKRTRSPQAAHTSERHCRLPPLVSGEYAPVTMSTDGTTPLIAPACAIGTAPRTDARR